MPDARASMSATSNHDVALGWRLLDAVIWLWRAVRITKLRPHAGYFLILLSVSLVALLAVGIAFLAWDSIHAFDTVLSELGDLSTENYDLIFSEPYYWRTFARTIGISILVTAVAVFMALPLAYTMVRTRSRLARFALLCIAFLPFLIGEMIRGYSWLIVLGRDGALAWFTDLIGLGAFTPIGTPFAVSLGIFQLLLPLAALILLPAVRAIDPELEEAAATLGSRPRRTWLHLVLPLSRRGLAAAAAVCFTFAMTSFAMPTLLGLGRHDFVANVIHLTYFGQLNNALGAAIGVLLVIVVSAGVGLLLAAGETTRLPGARRNRTHTGTELASTQ